MTDSHISQSADSASDRFRRVAAGFTERVQAVPEEGWTAPAPCEGWTARDVVAHLVGWVPGVLGAAGVVFPPEASDDDPEVAWVAVAETIQAALDDPEVAERRFDAGPPGELTVAAAVDMLVTGDVLIHTWDLARAAGLDETIDEAVAAGMLAGMEPMDEMLRDSGHFGPKVEPPPGADVQTRLIAFTGRTP